MKHTVKVAMVQDNFLVGDIQGNADKIIGLSELSREQGADLVIFPELALTGYPPEDLLYRRSFMVQVEKALAHIQSQVNGVDILLGLPLKKGNVYYNSAVWLRDGQFIASYHKQELPNYAVFDEKRYFAAGTQSVVVELKGVKFGLAICEDVWQPGPVAAAKAEGAEVMLVLNASPFHVGKYEDRLAVLTRRCQENNLPVLYLNMVGGQDELVFDGESLVMDRSGELVSRAPAFEPVLNIVEVSSGQVVVPGKHETGALSETEAIYKALVMGVRDFVRNNGFTGVVIG
ncbi:MAG: NAD+ synthase, partial [Gammaproteobacteria bacterium]|nr:NAD+ synthase [Gammaproteobacteria bacterium]